MSPNTTTFYKLIFCITFLFSCLGCNLMHLKEDFKEAESSNALVGNISCAAPPHDVPVVVGAYYKTGKTRTIAHYTTLHKPGPYELMVPTGTYTIVAFGDKNRNLVYDKGEPAGEILSEEQVEIPSGGVIGNLDIVLTDHANTPIDLPVGSRFPAKDHGQFHSTCPGAIADLDNKLFSDSYGKKGFWSGLDFYKEIGGNVYFLEPYDPNKIPILFVHGAAGSPQNFRTLFKRIDRTKFQPWFFYYPSGTSIEGMSYLLLWKMSNLQAQYKCPEIYITAHSMGGLVARSFLTTYGHIFPNITTFISISTPWGGEKLAELGVKYSPGVIPAWIDMQPESEFFQNLYSKPLPPHIDHYLFFGHKGNRNILRPNNDKVVTIASQLDPRSQKEAKMVYGFHEDHVSILSCEAMLSHYNAILADRYQQSRTHNQTPGNRIQVDFNFDVPQDQPKPMPALLLRPLDTKGSDSWIHLTHEDSGTIHGPFPPGDYEVSLLAPAFSPEPKILTTTIEPNTTPQLNFVLKPTGFLRGIIVKHEQNYIQAGKYLQRDATIKIKTITLKGKGVLRTVTPPPHTQIADGSHDPIVIPLKDEEKSYIEHSINPEDITTGGIFAFFNLPGGNYTLTIEAEGYLPYTQQCTVIPGDYKNSLAIKLAKE